MIKKAVIGIVACLLALVAFVALKSPDFKISRQIVVNVPAPVVYAHVNDFHLWQDWSPWAKLDPQAKNTFGGPMSGTGAIFSWDGNDQVGTGTMIIVDSSAPTFVSIRLEFLKPFKATNHAEFSFVPEGDGATRVMWTMTGQQNFFMRFICLFMNMDKMVGGEFEKGLTQLKSIAESEVAGKTKPQ